MTLFRNKLPKGTKLILIFCIGCLLLRFILHYSESGFFEFIVFDMFPTQWIIVLLPFVILFYQLYKKNVRFSAANNFLIAGITFYMIHFAMTPINLDKLDWKINYSKRKKIIELAKANQLHNISGPRYKIPSSLTLFPFIKGDDVIVNYINDKALTIQFFTDRGLVDSYSVFEYSNDETHIKELDRLVAQGGYNSKKERGWYYIHY